MSVLTKATIRHNDEHTLIYGRQVRIRTSGNWHEVRALPQRAPNTAGGPQGIATSFVP